MDDILKITESNLKLNKTAKAKKSKYTDEQKASIIEAVRLAKKLNALMARVVERNAVK